MEPKPISGGDYQAFISYRHANNREPGRQWATWLHQKLETYEVPADLVGTKNERGEEIPARIFPVFRDEDELPADADLAKPIYRALDRSRLLVVLCSPQAVESTYVADEIRYFKQLGRADKVLAVLLSGEPGDEARECFPEPLKFAVSENGEILRDLPAEPIAADLRLDDGSEGWTSPEAYRRKLEEETQLTRAQVLTKTRQYEKRCGLAVLKVIAGVLGVPLGQLTKRDQAYQLELARRKTRALRRWLAAVVVLFIAAVAAMVRAVEQQRLAEASAIAERHAKERSELARKAADDVINVMVYDLRDELRERDLTPLLDRILGVANDYFLTFPPDERSPLVRINEAAVLSKTSYDLLENQDVPNALATARQAVGMTRELVAESPYNPSRRRDLAVAIERLSDALRHAVGPAEALDTYREAFSIFEDLDSESSTPITRGTLATANEKIANLLVVVDGAKAALPYFDASFALRRALYEADPSLENARRVAVLCQSLARARRDVEGAAKARPFLNLFYETAKQLFAGHPSAHNKHLLSIAEQDMGEFHMASGDWENALVFFRRMQRLADELHTANPSLKNLSNLSVAHQKIGSALALGAQWEEAEAEFLINLKTARQIADTEPTAESLRDIALAEQFLGNVARANGDLETAETYYQNYRDGLMEVRKLLGSTLQSMDEAAMACSKLAGIRVARERWSEVVEAGSQGIALRREIISRLGSDTLPRHHFLLADELSLLGYAEMALHRYEDAVRTYREAVESYLSGLERDDDPAQLFRAAEARLLSALCLIQLKRYDEAIMDLEACASDLERLDATGNSPMDLAPMRALVQDELQKIQAAN